MSDESESVSNRLARFTPSAGGLDRDAILFAAGRKASRSSLWPIASGILAATQVLTVVLLWPATPESRNPALIPTEDSPAISIELPSSPLPGEVWSAGSKLDVLHVSDRPTNSEFIASGATLTVGSFREFE